MAYELHPDPAGDLGERTVLDTSQHPPIVEQLHYELEYWDGDDLLASFPVYLVTERLRAALEASGLSGISFAPAEVTGSDNVTALGYGTPPLVWMKVIGSAGTDDFWLGTLAELYVSEAALALLRQFNIEHCQVEAL